MTLLNVGQPIGGIIQIAYTVPDIEKAVRSYAQDLKLGPWFLRGPLQARKPVYRGNPQKLELSIAIAYSGHVMIELIQQHDEQPSVYREVIDKQGYGFHHWGIASDRFDNDLSSYVERGFELVFTDETPVSTRVAYLDPKRGWPGFIELIEINTASELRYSKMYADALLWDGADPIRKV
jgi:hypothetical protein